MRLVRKERMPGAVKVFFALAFIVFTCVFPYNAGINNPNENVRVYMTMAIVEHHTFVIDKIVDRQGWVNDMAKVPDKETGGFHYYCIKGPATGYLGVPFYWVMTKVAPWFGHPVPSVESPLAEKQWWMRATTLVVRLFAVQVPCFVFLLWFERWLRAHTRDTVLRLSAVAAVGLGTNYLAYALMFTSHALFAVAAFASFGITLHERLRFLHDPRRRRASRAFLAGLFAGLATLLEYHALPVSVCLAVYALFTFWRPTRLLALAGGGLVSIIGLTFYQWRCYGNPLTPGHKMAETPQFAAYHAHGFFGLGEPSWQVFRDLSVSPQFGFFGMSPFMWLGLLVIPFGIMLGSGPPSVRRSLRWANIVWLSTMFILWFAISCAINWRGGWTVGPRFFGAAPPFFAFGAVVALERLGRKGRFWRAVARGAAGGLAVAGVLQIGFVAIVYNSVPEEVARPFLQLSLPLARAGFVPHHVGELFGWMSPTAWYIVAGCLMAAAFVAVLWPAERERVGGYVARVLTAGVFFAAGFAPALIPPWGEPPPDDGTGARAFFARTWEPQGRDRIATLREMAERFGPRRPCLWYQLADLERSVGLLAEASRDERRAEGTAREECR